MKLSSTSNRMRLATLTIAAQMVMLAALGTVPAQAQNPAPRRGEPITLNFTNAEIEAVARTMAVVTGRDVVVDPRVKGNITLITDRAVSPAAAFNQFASTLRLQGFAIVESEGLYKIVPEAEAKLQSNTVTTSTSATERVGGSQIITQVFKLNYESPNNLLPVLRPLIAPNNTINVNPGNNSLVITDYATNMNRLARIIAALDVPNASEVEVIQLRHSIASDLVPLVYQLIEGGSSGAVPGGPGGGRPGGAPGQVDASFRTTLMADPRSNAIIMRAANPARAQLVRTLIDKLDRPPVETGNGEAGNIYVVYLKNADAVRLAQTLRAAIAADPKNSQSGSMGVAGGGAASASSTQGQSSMLNSALQGMSGNSSSSFGASSAATSPLNNANQPSTGGQVQADPSTNSLIITASEPQYRQLRAVIDRLDSRRAQVMVEALIAEVRADKAAQFGIQWQGLLGGKDNQYAGFNSSVTGANILNLSLGNGTASGAPSQGLNIGIGATINGQNVLGFLANFLQSNDEANILSTPNLITLDNEEAKIVVGQNAPFPTGTYTNTSGIGNTVNPFTTVERKDVGLTLRVRPTINEDNTVKLQIFQEVSTIQGGTLNNAYGPTTNKRAIESSVVVDDGNVILLGGLLQDEYSNTTDKVPLAGDIPVVGALFRNEARTRTKTNLMVFLRPVVIRENNTSNVLAYDRYEALRSIQSRVQPDADQIFLRNVKDAPMLPPMPLPPPTPAPTQSNAAKSSNNDRRIEGTRLVPPPIAPLEPSLGPSPLKGALPPTADPASARELP
ncbi:type II secretion system secretin GspD [Variovorax dokdonensis]|uniref:Type II secretion system secretin GspD n=1 Tax=Variovorax dokdonensis TaxID=344883 RepID=A0ABT7NBN7_9BURK|nr:type II secretion system secretin GspD [Variovorax dokdonensis]MDM0045333.1 type II secretion system secretin GspD [Variovorax dokdonensis]